MWEQPIPDDLQRGVHDLVDGGEVRVPQELGLLLECQHALRADAADGGGDLQEQSLAAHHGRFAPVDGLREGQLPAVAQQHWDAGGLQCLQEAEGAQAPATGHDAEGGVVQQLLVVKLFIVHVVLVAACVLVPLPVLAMPAGGERHDVLPVVDVVQSISGAGADPGQVALPLEHQQIFLFWGHRVVVQPPPLPAALRVLPGEERDGDIEAGPEVLAVEAGLGQHGVADVKTQLLGVIGPRARIQVEDEVVAAAVPQREGADPLLHAADVVSREGVAVQRVDAQHEETRFLGARGVITRALDGAEDLAVALRHGLAVLPWVCEHLEAILAAGGIEAALHAAPAALGCAQLCHPPGPG